MNPKVLAFYLPQFHRVKENDEWWGEGFTEWTTVKAAEKLFDGHNQPRVPLNQNYYDLTEHDTMAWQAGLMHKYRIDGMCMYHYWFENGRRILEKPAENLLGWKDIPMPFCFCWANETWSRTWEKFTDVNVWVGKDSPERNPHESNILLKQTYGREKDWEEHLRYLLPFFKDSRYIKLDGKPVFCIFKPGQIFQLWEMVSYFNRRAMDNGFPGIYIIGMEEGQKDGMDAACIRQPYCAVQEYQKRHGYTWQGLKVYPYDEVCKIQMEEKAGDAKTYFCCAVDFDSTPRMGNNGLLLQGASPEKFYGFFRDGYRKSLRSGNEFVFLNAWNEWGEGMYLEPDEKYGCQYLEAVRRVVDECGRKDAAGDVEGIPPVCETGEDKKEQGDEEALQSLGRHDRLLDNWMNLRDRGISFSSYFEKYGYKKIAIYGMGRLGTHLQWELRDGDVLVCFGIDQKGQSGEYAMDVYLPYREMPETDAVVITVLGEYRKISELLRNTMKCPIITLEEIVQELLFECQDMNPV